jgi:hypothetical protein
VGVTNADEADVFNQWAAEVDMDSVLRKIHREEYTLSQCIVAVTWGWREYTVRGKEPRRRTTTTRRRPA